MPWMLNLKEIILGPRVDEKAPHEKRLAPRVSCFIEASFVTEDRSSFDGHITVLELSGMRIVTPMKIVKGQKLIVRVDSFTGVLITRPFSVEDVNAEVVWCKRKKGFSQHMAGIRFSDTSEVIRNSWVHFVLESFGIKESTGFQRRREVRVQASLPVTCTYGKNKSVRGIAYDISIDGAKMSFKGDISVGTEVEMKIGPYRNLSPFSCHGKIRRSNYNPGNDEFTVGVEFMGLNDRKIGQIGNYVRTILKESST